MLELDGRIWPATVAEALEYINTDVRPNEIGPSDEMVKAKRPPASLSWAFIRFVEGVEDAESWQTIWQTIGASPEECERFCCSPTARIAARQLITALNKFVPGPEQRSHRCPT